METFKNQQYVPNIYKYDDISDKLDCMLTNFQINSVIIITELYKNEIRKKIYELCEKNNLYHRGFLDKNVYYSKIPIYKCYAADDDINCNYKGPINKWSSW